MKFVLAEKDYAMPQRCQNAKRYKGLRAPKCLNGVGCDACWNVYSLRAIQKTKKSRRPSR